MVGVLSRLGWKVDHLGKRVLQPSGLGYFQTSSVGGGVFEGLSLTMGSLLLQLSSGSNRSMESQGLPSRVTTRKLMGGLKDLTGM